MASNGSVRKRNANTVENRNGRMPKPIENIVDYSRHEAGMADAKPQDTLANMVICVSGIYAAL
jgi:hypothetical protein